MAQPVEVRRYYDGNTGSFLRFGHGRSHGAIHRAVFGPGATTRELALRYADDQIARRAAGLAAEPRLLDLGCGVCASLCRIAEKLPIQGTGVTLSPVQVVAARERIRAAGLEGRIRPVEADYNELPDAVERADLAFAIESFVHGSTPARFFSEAARKLLPGGLLIVCDDFLGDAAGTHEAEPWLERFRYGWHVGSLLAEAEAQQLAQKAGFAPVETLDLTPYLELGRPRDLAIAALVRAASFRKPRRPYLRMLYGGHALQVCLKRGYVRYLFLVWARQR